MQMLSLLILCHGNQTHSGDDVIVYYHELFLVQISVWLFNRSKHQNMERWHTFIPLDILSTICKTEMLCCFALNKCLTFAKSGQHI
jgi:hypothetical protein